LLGPPIPPDPVIPIHECDEPCSLSQDISTFEVAEPINKLKWGKAAGLDGVKVEFVIDGCDALLAFLQTLFNKLFNEGFCGSLVVGVIHALFKSGDASSVDNYRGITVGPVIAKIFAMVLESKLSCWVEEQGIWARGQAGFKKDFCTTDNLFVLQTLIESQAGWKGKKLFTCFVDFRKAFDTIPHAKLWHVLQGIGVGGRFLACLRSMYSQDRACVTHPTKGLSNTFACTIGVKQGCPLSPLLFGLYIDALEPRIAALDDDDGLDLAGTPVKLLLYADDLVLMSRTQRGLQKQLDELGKFYDERDLMVNVKKTKVVVFGSRVNTSPLLYGGLPIEEVASFRYLGVELHCNGSMKTAVEHLAAASKRTVFALRRRCADLKINDLAIICQLFDALVKPVISYACELWVNEVATDSLELIHVSFLKLLLSVNRSTPTRIVLSEFGRFALKLFWQ